MISISFVYEKEENYSFLNTVTKPFELNDGIYYTILNLDGKIRRKKLFKGNTFSKIEIIDLNGYESIKHL